LPDSHRVSIRDPEYSRFTKWLARLIFGEPVST
jgi:hypothetical protein